MKVNGFGQSKVLTPLELDQLFQWGFTNSRDRCLFSICLHTGFGSKPTKKAEKLDYGEADDYFPF